jgi:spore germination protein YaaH
MVFMPTHIYRSIKLWSAFLGSVVGSFGVFLVLISPTFSLPNIAAFINPMADSMKVSAKSSNHEVLGFAPYWTIKKLQNIDYQTLTTLAYFGLPITADGTYDINSPGYQTLFATETQEVFKKTHKNGKRVIATVSIMDNLTINQFLGDPWAQEQSIESAKGMMKAFALDGFNIDIEYVGAANSQIRDAFSQFVEKFHDEIHAFSPNAEVSVSVYAAAMKDNRLYDIRAIGNAVDHVFMMAYDFATSGAQVAMPTAPLYGYKVGKYWYDVSTAVEDFLTVMPAEKLILGVPYYGYNYAVSAPGDKAPTIQNRYTRSFAQT